MHIEDPYEFTMQVRNCVESDNNDFEQINVYQHLYWIYKYLWKWN